MASRHNSILPYRPLGSNQETQDFTHQYLARVETPVVTNMERREDASKRKLDRFIDPALIMLMLVSYPDQDNIQSTSNYGKTIDTLRRFLSIHLPGIARVVIEKGQLALLRLSRSH
jgi:hypothetical protein